MLHKNYFNEAKKCHEFGELTNAARLYQKTLENNPKNADAWHLMGLVAHQKKNNELAVKLIKTAIEINGASADFHSDLGRVYSTLGRIVDAELEYRRAIELNSHHVKALSNLAGLLRITGQFSAAVEYAKMGVLFGPEDPEAHNNLGNALKDIKLPEEAITAYQRAIKLEPDYALAHWNLSLLLLSLERFEEGFEEMMWRWKWDGFPAKLRELDRPRLKVLSKTNGELVGKRILLHAEQGLGDTIHFIRYAPLLRDRSAHVIFECPPQLEPLLKGADLVDEITCSNNDCNFDLHTSLLDLPYLLGTNSNNLPETTPYLNVPIEITEKWKEKTRGIDKFKIGLNWQGNSDSPVEHFRRLSPVDLQPLSSFGGVSWFSLQKGPNHNNAGTLSPDFQIIDTGPDALVETAGLIKNLDLVITSDTAVAHLAGSLDKPVWILLHHAPDWRWTTTGDSSTWYPSARLFRQVKPGEWDTVIKEVISSLKNSI